MDSRLIVLLMCLAATLAGDDVPLKCDPDIVKKIKAYWADHGVPQNILGFKGTLKSYVGTETEVNKRTKCRTFQVNNGKLDITIDGVKQSYEATAADGILNIAGNTLYMVAASKGVLAGYSCMPNGATPTNVSVADAGIAVALNADLSTRVAAKNALKSFGFSLTKYYNCN